MVYGVVHVDNVVVTIGDHRVGGYGIEGLFNPLVLGVRGCIYIFLCKLCGKVCPFDHGTGALI